MTKYFVKPVRILMNNKYTSQYLVRLNQPLCTCYPKRQLIKFTVLTETKEVYYYYFFNVIVIAKLNEYL